MSDRIPRMAPVIVLLTWHPLPAHPADVYPILWGPPPPPRYQYAQMSTGDIVVRGPDDIEVRYGGSPHFVRWVDLSGLPWAHREAGRLAHDVPTASEARALLERCRHQRGEE